MDATTFVMSFPEFSATDPGLIQAKLNEAALEINTDSCAFGPYGDPTQPALVVSGQLGGVLTLADKAQAYLAAHLLQQSAFGGPTRLDPEAGDGRTTYWAEYQRIVAIVGTGGMVT